MGREYLFAEQATIHDVVAHQKKEFQKALEELPAETIMTGSLNGLVAEIVNRFRLDVSALDRTGIVQLPNEEVDIDVSHDYSRDFHTPGPPYIKGTALRIAVPFRGEVALFRYRASPYNSPIPGEVTESTVILTYSAERRR